jgi:hypothetical protein
MATIRQLARFLSARSLGSAMQCTLSREVMALFSAMLVLLFLLIDSVIYALVLIYAPNCFVFCPLLRLTVLSS